MSSAAPASKNELPLPMSILNHSPAIKWIRKRHSGCAKDQYKLTPSDLVKHREVETVFKKFDEDGSGSLDTQEVDKMLSRHGIEIPRAELRELFTLIAGHPTNELNLD